MSLGARLKSSFVAGVLLVSPLVITLIVLKVVAGWTLIVINPVVAGTRLADLTGDMLAAQVVAAVLVVATVTVLGALAQWSVGSRLFGGFGRVVELVPLVSVIYVSVRQVASSLVDRNTRYESVVLVEYPREGLYSIGLVTAESPTTVETVTGSPAVNVFLPNSPNPTAGRLVLVPEDQVHEIDMSVREGMRLIVTTGMGSDEDVVPEAYLDDSELES